MKKLRLKKISISIFVSDSILCTDVENLVNASLLYKKIIKVSNYIKVMTTAKSMILALIKSYLI
jgi:hypothetical protein